MALPTKATAETQDRTPFLRLLIHWTSQQIARHLATVNGMPPDCLRTDERNSANSAEQSGNRTKYANRRDGAGKASSMVKAGVESRKDVIIIPLSNPIESETDWRGRLSPQSKRLCQKSLFTNEEMRLVLFFPVNREESFSFTIWRIWLRRMTALLIHPHPTCPFSFLRQEKGLDPYLEFRVVQQTYKWGDRINLEFRGRSLMAEENTKQQEIPKEQAVQNQEQGYQS